MNVLIEQDDKVGELRESSRKVRICAEIASAIKMRHLTQVAAAQMLGIDQAKVSRITRGQYRGISETKLLELLVKLGHDVKILVSPTRDEKAASGIELTFD